MALFLRMAWRNLWRNYRRSAITLSALSLALAFMIVVLSIIEFMFGNMEHNVTALNLADAQLHHEGYRIESRIHQTIPNIDRVVSVAADLGIEASARAFGYGLISAESTGKSAVARVQGIVPEAEKEVTELHLPKYLMEGSYLTGKSRTKTIEPADLRPETAEDFDDPLVDFEDPLADVEAAQQPDSRELVLREVVLGNRLADTLDVAIGDEVTLVVSAADGSLGNELFFVSGIFNNFSEAEDRTLVLMDRPGYQSLFHLGANEAHEVAFRLPDDQPLEEGVSTLRSRIKDLPDMEDTELLSWKELVPQMVELLESSQAMNFMFTLIMFIGAGLVVMNAMLMMVFERFREFGVMKALGMTGGRVLALVYLETLFLCFVGTGVGLALGLAGVGLIQYYRIDLTSLAPEGLSFSGTVIDPNMSAVLTPAGVYQPVVALFLVSLLAVAYPGMKAALIDPLAGIHHQ